MVFVQIAVGVVLSIFARRLLSKLGGVLDYTSRKTASGFDLTNTRRK
ncbi:MAG: hypothetical protein JWN43_2732 [Gammaproteobacteria bacterium]|nr:hypothetical protein [Gammaproteobacteria bacterium]